MARLSTTAGLDRWVATNLLVAKKHGGAWRT
jgi:hypothetical protein